MSAPPVALVRAVTRLAGWLARIRRRLLPSHYAAVELGTMSWVALALSAFCELDLPQALATHPKSAATLAEEGYGEEALLFRLLRALCAYDVVRYVGNDRFTLGHAGKALVGDHSAAPMIRYANAPWHVAAYTRLADTVRHGRPGFDLANGAPMFDFYATNRDAGEIFDAAMQSLVPLFGPAFAQAYDFSNCSRVVDIGGGTGLLLAHVLERYPRVRGTIFELPGVADAAAELARYRGLVGRLDVVEGDILKDAPPPADAYIFSHVLHDWDDATCTRMLQNVRRAMPEHGRVLVYEIVAAPPNNRWAQDRISDLEMLAMLSGRERTRAEFEALFASAGLRLTRTIATGAAESVIVSEVERPRL